VVLSFATARLGVILVPVNFMLGADEIAFILDHSEATCFVAEDALVGVAEQAIGRSRGSVRTRAYLGLAAADTHPAWQDAQAWFDHRGLVPETDVGDDDPIRLMYTSGTESRPKGALLSSRSLMWQYVSCVIDGGMASDDVEVHTLPLYHCAQLDCFLGPDVYVGGPTRSPSCAP